MKGANLITIFRQRHQRMVQMHCDRLRCRRDLFDKFTGFSAGVSHHGFQFGIARERLAAFEVNAAAAGIRAEIALLLRL